MSQPPGEALDAGSCHMLFVLQSPNKIHSSPCYSQPFGL
jgi:hypothetical protein